MESYQYKAFISYRHLEPDQTIAKKLHTLIENFGIPASLKKSCGIQKMGRVFRDQEELPLSSDLGADIHTALEHSEWLIVICSPKLKESLWCLEEINYFISLGKRDHILTVLVEGEPEDSFPEVLCYRELDGKQVLQEPLAADVRDSSLSGSLKKLKNEKLRILAPMLGVHYDDLRQRARARKRRIIAIVSAAAFAVVFGFLAYVIIQNRKLDAERKISMNNEMKLLMEESNSEVSGGNKLRSADLLLRAADIRKQIGNGNDEQFESALEYAAYAGSFETVLNINGNNRKFGEFVFSEDDSRLLAVTNVNSVCMIDSKSGEILYTVSRTNTGMVDEAGFLDHDQYFYMLDSWYGFVSVYKTEDGSFVRELDLSDGTAWNIAEKAFALEDGRLLVVKRDTLTAWNYETDQCQDILPVSESGVDSYTQGLIVSLSNDRKKVAVGSHGIGGSFLYDLETGERTTLESAAQRGYYELDFSADDRYLGAVSGTKYIVWDTQSGKDVLFKDFDSKETMTEKIILSSKGTYAAVTGMDKVIVKNVSSGKTLWSMDTDSEVVISCVFSGDEQYLSLTGGITGIFDARTGSQISDLGGTVFSHDGKYLITGSYENDPSLLTTPESSTVYSTEKFNDPLYSAERFTEPGWSIQIEPNHVAGNSAADGIGNTGSTSQFYSDPEDHYLALAYEDGFIELFDISERPEVVSAKYALGEHCYFGVSDIVFSKELMASCGGYDPRCVLFDLEKGSIRYVLMGTEYCHGSEFSPDGSKIILLCGYERNRAPVYSTSTGNLLFTLESDSPIKEVGFTEDGTRAVAALEDGSYIIGNLYSDIEEMISSLK